MTDMSKTSTWQQWPGTEREEVVNRQKTHTQLAPFLLLHLVAAFHCTASRKILCIMPFHNKSCFSVFFILKKIYNLTEKTRKTTTSQRSEWQAVVHLVRLIAEKKRTVPIYTSIKTAALSVDKIY